MTLKPLCNKMEHTHQTNPGMCWHCKTFAGLSNEELYRILQLRSDIFVVEQNCVYLDFDDRDFQSYHLFAMEGGSVVAYSRLVPPGVSYPENPSIGRIVVRRDKRKLGLGSQLVERSIVETTRIFGEGAILIAAQNHLRQFYARLGFSPVGDVYDEDGIPHITMIRP